MSRAGARLACARACVRAWLASVWVWLAWARLAWAWLRAPSVTSADARDDDARADARDDKRATSTTAFADLGLDELLVVAGHLDACSVAALARCSRDLRRCLAPAAAARHEANQGIARDFWTRWDRACQGHRNDDASLASHVHAHRQFWTLLGAASDADQWRPGSWDGQVVLGDRIHFWTASSSSYYTMTLDSEPFECRWYPKMSQAFVQSSNRASNRAQWRTLADLMITEFTQGNDTWPADARAALDALQEPSAETRDLAARDHGDDTWLVAKVLTKEHDALRAQLLDAVAKCGPGRSARYAVRVMNVARQQIVPPPGLAELPVPPPLA